MSFARRVKVTLGVGLALGLLGGGINERQDIATYYSLYFAPETPQERTISSVLSRYYGSLILVRCRPEGSFEGRVMGRTDTSELGRKLGPAIELLTPVCNSLSEVIADPDNPADIVDESQALMYVTHELSHQLGDGQGHPETNEGITDCYAIQRVFGVAEAAGANGSVANAYAETNVLSYMPATVAYLPPAECRDGGVYDLDPEQPDRYFPQTTAANTAISY